MRGILSIIFLSVLGEQYVHGSGVIADNAGEEPAQHDPPSSSLSLLGATDNKQGEGIIIIKDEVHADDIGDNQMMQSIACAYHESCDSCLGTFGCHWCEFDSMCHVQGSVYGCIAGAASCPGAADNTSSSDVPEEPEDKSCFGITSCNECSATYSCHWCEFDNACHLKGSLYGCLSGVSCYSNDRCERKTPEPVPVALFPLPESTEEVIFTWPEFIILIVLSCASLMGITCLFCAAGVGKDFYDDFTVLTGASQDLMEGHRFEPYVPDTLPSKKSGNVSAAKDRFSEMTSLINDERRRYINDEEEEGYDYDLLLKNADEALAAQEPLLSNDKRVRKKGSWRVDCLFNSCRLCYLFTAGFIVLTALAIVSFYPQYPAYNVCSNQLDWKSIADGMTSLKMQASFQILISIYNPNKFDALLDMGAGSFKHDGVHVGTFEIPSESAKAMSITDYLVTVTLTPDEWQALELTSEYYKGTLTFVVDAHVTVTLPALGGYTFQTQFDDYFIHVGDEMSDRHLCACSSWEEEKARNK